MKNLDKMEVFRECGFTHFEYPIMPAITFDGYDKVMDYCYTAGRMDVNRIHITQDEGGIKNLLDTWELVKKCKDLETANARLFARNHELQVDNEESLKEVENQYKIVADLIKNEKYLVERDDELRQENLEYSKRCDIMRQENQKLIKSLETDRKIISDLRNMNAHPWLYPDVLPKSKFVITVEEF